MIFYHITLVFLRLCIFWLFLYAIFHIRIVEVRDSTPLCSTTKTFSKEKVFCIMYRIVATKADDMHPKTKRTRKRTFSVMDHSKHFY